MECEGKGTRERMGSGRTGAELECLSGLEGEAVRRDGDLNGRVLGAVSGDNIEARVGVGSGDGLERLGRVDV